MTPVDQSKPTWWTSDEWETPSEVVEPLAQEFGPFDLDPCAREENAKAPFYWSREDDGLQQEWAGKVWLNPPYSDPAPWLAKAVEEIDAGRASVVVALLPAATDTAWFHDLVVPYATIRYRRGRIKFLGWEGAPIGSPKAGSLIAIYQPRPLGIL